MRHTVQPQTRRQLWEAYRKHNILFWASTPAKEERDLRYARFGFLFSSILLIPTAFLEMSFVVYVLYRVLY